MTYLLDTNTISEWVKPRPDQGVVQWFDDVDEDRTHLSVITLGELRKGIDRLATDDDANDSNSGSPQSHPTASTAASCRSTPP